MVLVRAIALACFFALLTASGGARGDGLKHKAQILLSEGNELARIGDFGTALVKFRTAHELYPSPKLLLNIGTSLRHVGRLAEAAATYEQYLEHPESDPGRQLQLRKLLTELQKHVGTVELRTFEADVRVSIDGHMVTPIDRTLVVRVDPGRHTVVAEKPGRPATVRHVTVEARQTAMVELVIAKPGEAPPEPLQTRKILGYTLAGLGGVGIITGGILGVVALNTKADADEHCPSTGRYRGLCSAEGADLNEQARALGVGATVTFITGFVFAAGGLAVAFAPTDDTAVQVEMTGAPSMSFKVRF